MVPGTAAIGTHELMLEERSNKTFQMKNMYEPLSLQNNTNTAANFVLF